MGTYRKKNVATDAEIIKFWRDHKTHANIRDLARALGTPEKRFTDVINNHKVMMMREVKLTHNPKPPSKSDLTKSFREFVRWAMTMGLIEPYGALSTKAINDLRLEIEKWANKPKKQKP